MRASHIKAERMPGWHVVYSSENYEVSIVPSEPQVRTSTLCHVLLKRRKVLAPKPQSILQWVVRNIIVLSKGEKHETSTHI